MIYVQLFWAFFIPAIVGYGGGPATIPFIEHEVVDHYGWMTTSAFSEVLAMANTLPGPIATKMAGYIGFELAGGLGAVIAIMATVMPSLLLMLLLLNLFDKYKNSPKAKRLSKVVLPTVSVLMATLTVDFFHASYVEIGLASTAFITVIAFFLLEKIKLHPAFVIMGGLVLGVIFL